MWSHTHSLECLVIGATVAPAELVRVATSFAPGGGSAAAGGPTAADRVRQARVQTLGVPAAYAAVCLLAVAVAASGHFTPGYLTAWGVDRPWLAAAVGVGAAVIVLEFGVGAVPAVLRGARGVGLRIIAGPGSVGLVHLASLVVTAVAEEVLYRGLWIGTLHDRLHVATAVAVAAAAVAYALGHLFFGAVAVAQKAATGAVFGVLLVASGSLVVPLVAHVAQNLTVSGLAARQAERR